MVVGGGGWWWCVGRGPSLTAAVMSSCTVVCCAGVFAVSPVLPCLPFAGSVRLSVVSLSVPVRLFVSLSFVVVLSSSSLSCLSCLTCQRRDGVWLKREC